MRRVGLLLFALLIAILPSCDRPTTNNKPSPIRIETIVRSNPALHAVIARVDLSDPRVQVVVCNGGPPPDGSEAWETVLRTPSDTARENHLDLAINGGFFFHQAAAGDPTKYSAGDPGNAAALVIIDGKRVSASSVGDALAVDANGRVTIGQANEVLAAKPVYALGGPAWIVYQGEPCVSRDEPPAPRSAVGLSEDGKTLILMVVDGRRADWGLGLTEKALAKEMANAGAYQALSLDGGGSSAMAMKSPDGHYHVLNRPSDGSTLPVPLSVERPVPYVLGVRVQDGKSRLKPDQTH